MSFASQSYTWYFAEDEPQFKVKIIIFYRLFGLYFDYIIVFSNKSLNTYV